MLRAMIALMLVTCAAPVAEAQLTALERQRLMAHLDMTAGWLEDELAGLSAVQMTFRPAPGAWSILDVLDHLVVVGPIYWRDLQNAKPVKSGPAGMMNDADVLWYGIDRANRETALKTEEPARTLKDVTAGLRSYRAQHAQLVHYVRTTNDDLRRRFVERQNSDAYQWAL